MVVTCVAGLGLDLGSFEQICCLLWREGEFPLRAADAVIGIGLTEVDEMGLVDPGAGCDDANRFSSCSLAPKS